MYTDRLNIIARIFRARLKRLIHLIRVKAAFGPYKAYIYTVKYQKRELPHTHIIVFIHAGHAFSKPEHINNLIRAELLDRQLNPNKSLTTIIKQTMIHDPYSPLNPISPYITKK